MHLLQIVHPENGTRVGIVREPLIQLLHQSVTSAYQLFTELINTDGVSSLKDMTDDEFTLPYDEVYLGKSDWKLLPPIHCPDNPMMCILSGTGLTHKASAENRQKMHSKLEADALTDSMKMYLWGEEGGKPAQGKIGIQPEWFYKGNGHNLKTHGQVLRIPNYALDGGEEPELAVVYMITKKGIPYRLGWVQANEFSDHVMEKRNYLYLAPSKLRECAIGPELVTSLDFTNIPGEVSIIRQNNVYWNQSIRSGEEAMAHSLENLEYHHFKYAQHRLPGQLHIHFLGADAFSFGEGINLLPQDIMQVSFKGMGRPLANTLEVDTTGPELIEVRDLWINT